MARRCSAIKADGQRCASVIVGSDGLCQAHGPRYAAMRKRRAAKLGAKLKHSDTFEDIHQRIDDLYAKVLEDKIPSAVGAVCNQLLQTKLRTLDQQRKTEELEDLTRRIEELEAQEERVQNTNGRSQTGGRWR